MRTEKQHLGLQQTTFEKHESLIFIFMDDLAQRETEVLIPFIDRIIGIRNKTLLEMRNKCCVCEISLLNKLRYAISST